MRPVKKLACFFLNIFTAWIDNSSSDSNYKISDSNQLNEKEFVTKTVDFYEGYKVRHTDLQGNITPVDEKVIGTQIVINTIKRLGFNAPETTIVGLFNNFYTDPGFAVDQTID